MIHVNITNFVLISELEKYHSMIEMYQLNDVIFFKILIKVIAFHYFYELTFTLLKDAPKTKF